MSKALVTFPKDWREMPVWALLLINKESRNWRKGFVGAETYFTTEGHSDLVYVFVMSGYWVIDRVNSGIRKPSADFVRYN